MRRADLPVDHVTLIKLGLAAPETRQFLTVVARAEIDTLGGDAPAALLVAGTMYQIAIELVMHASKRDRRGAAATLHRWESTR